MKKSLTYLLLAVSMTVNAQLSDVPVQQGTYTPDW